MVRLFQRQRQSPGPNNPRRPPQSQTSCLSLLATITLALLSTTLVDGVRAQQQGVNLTDAQVNIIVQRLAEGAKESWELGTRQQALIELNTPSFSVLNASNGNPGAHVPPPTTAPDSLSTVLSLISTVVQNRSSTISAQSLSSPQPLVPNDGSAADPASNGVAALIANWTGRGNSSLDFSGAAQDQMAFLWSKVPRTDDGALSHRVSQVQLWSDFIYMVPPFLAYYGVLTQNRSMVTESYNQISLYRNYLRSTVSPSSSSSSKSNSVSLWKHVVMGSDFTDEGFWSTGNGWAAAGMLRVLGTIQNSEYKNTLKSEVKDLRNWVNEIHDGMYTYIRSDGLFHNYATDNSTFTDAASAALLASTVYRHALLTKTYHHLPDAEFVRTSLWASSSSSSSTSPSPSYSSSSSLNNMTHFTSSSSSSGSDSASGDSDTSEGWLTPVVNPHSFGQEGSHSPEAQAFVLMMYAAWRDWVDAGAVGANAAVRTRGGVGMGGWGVLLLGLGLGVGVVVGW